MELHTTDESFDTLHQAVDKARKNAKDVKVPRQALIGLLMDHSKLINKVYQMGESITLWKDG